MTLNKKIGQNKPVLLILSILVICAALFLSMSQFILPQPLTADADAKVFSAGRAYGYLEQFATKPHYTGTKNLDEVRDILVRQIKDLGIEPQIQTANVLNGSTYGGVQNIVFKINGNPGGKTILIIGHYDTVPGSNGAADDGLSVACMIESARILVGAEPLRNNVLFLLSEEEQEMLGARAFADSYAKENHIDLVVNFDNRGNDGVPILYQTSEPGKRLAARYASAVPCPVGSSLLSNLYQLMPNITDFGVYNSQGFAGYNIAMGQGMNTYHNSSDNIKTVSLPAIQQYGDNMLALIEHFGNLADWEDGSGDAVFFSLFRSVMAAYPGWVSYPLLGAVLALFVYTLVSGIKKRYLKVRGILAGAGVCATVLIGAYFVGGGVFSFLCAINEHANWYLSNNDLTFAIPCLAGLLAVLFAGCLLLFSLAKKRIKPSDLLFGGYVIWLAAVTTFLLPGGSYLFAWSMLFAMIGFNLWVKKRNPLIMTAFSAPALLLGAPVIYYFFNMLTLSNAGILSVVVALLLILYVPLIRQLSGRALVLVFLAAFLAGGAAMVAVAINMQPSAQNPVGTEVNYVLDKDQDAAKTVSVYPPYGYSAQFVNKNDGYGSVGVPFYGRDVYYSQAPLVQMPEPEMKVISDNITDGQRTLNLTVKSPRKAELIYLQIENPVTVRRAMVNGSIQTDKPTVYDGAAKKYYLIFVNTKDNTNNIALIIDRSDVLKIKVLDISFGLPDSILEGKEKPGADIANYGDKTIVLKGYAF